MTGTLAGTHVGLVFSSLTGGGAERMMLTIADGLLDRGATVDIILTREEGEYVDMVPEDVTVFTLDADRELRSLPSLIRYLRDERPDYLLSTGTGINLISIWAKYLARTDTDVLIRVQVTLSADFRDTARLEHRLLPFLVKMTFPAADVVIGNSRGVASDLAEMTRLSLDDIRIVHNPTVTDDLFTQASEPVDLPWNRSENTKILVAAGRFVPQKDFSTLIQAFEQVRENQDVRLVVLGKGKLENELRTLTEQLDIASDVWFPGFVDNPYAYMNSADLFVLSSRWEGLPNVLIEALACGTKAVSTDCPSGPDEILAGGEYGTLVPVGEPDALAEGIETELATERDPDALTERAMDFSVETVLEDYVDLVVDCADD